MKKSIKVRAAQRIGRKGGLVRSLSKIRAAKRNGQRGGRPRSYPPCPKMYNNRPSHHFRDDRCPCGYVRKKSKQMKGE